MGIKQAVEWAAKLSPLAGINHAPIIIPRVTDVSVAPSGNQWTVNMIVPVPKDIDGHIRTVTGSGTDPDINEAFFLAIRHAKESLEALAEVIGLPGRYLGYDKLRRKICEMNTEDKNKLIFNIVFTLYPRGNIDSSWSCENVDRVAELLHDSGLTNCSTLTNYSTSSDED